jgi:hypothetical protein
MSRISTVLSRMRPAGSPVEPKEHPRRALRALRGNSLSYCRVKCPLVWPDTSQPYLVGIPAYSGSLIERLIDIAVATLLNLVSHAHTLPHAKRCSYWPYGPRQARRGNNTPCPAYARRMSLLRVAGGLIFYSGVVSRAESLTIARREPQSPGVAPNTPAHSSPHWAQRPSGVTPQCPRSYPSRPMSFVPHA